MKTKVVLSLVLVVIFIASALALTISRGTETEIDLKEPRDSKTQRGLDKRVAASHNPEELFVFARKIILGYRDWENDRFRRITREGNYIFENEKIFTRVFVRNPNGVSDTFDVSVTIGPSIGEGNDIESICVPIRNDEKNLNRRTRFNPKTDMWYDCEFTAETADSMYGEYWITVEAESSTDVAIANNMNLLYFFNPIIAFSVDGEIEFENIRPGETYLSRAILLINDVDAGSNVPLEFFISGTNFYDSSSSGARCPTSNQLSLKQFKYMAEYNGSQTEFESIPYSKPYSSTFSINTVKPIMNDVSILPGEEIDIVFELEYPEPCNGAFDKGKIYIWAKPKDNSPHTPFFGFGNSVDSN